MTSLSDAHRYWSLKIAALQRTLFGLNEVAQLWLKNVIISSNLYFHSILAC